MAEKEGYAGDPVEYLDSPGEATWDWGYRGPGWYFWDETWAYCHGPYDTQEEAGRKVDEYAAALDASLWTDICKATKAD